MERNIRPDFLQNPYTGHNLELDVFLPRFPIGIEVQGPHHNRDEEQMFRDRIKRQLCAEAGVHLIEISIFEVRPRYIKGKLLDYSRKFQKWVSVREQTSEWDELDKKITQYRKQIIAQYGASDDYCPPSALSARERVLEENRRLSRCLYVVINRGERTLRVKPTNWGRGSRISAQIIGGDPDVTIKIHRSDIIQFV